MPPHAAGDNQDSANGLRRREEFGNADGFPEFGRRPSRIRNNSL